SSDIAIDWALALEPIAKKVKLVHLRNNIRAHESTVIQLMNCSVDILTHYMITELNGEENHTKQIRLQEKDGDSSLDVDVDEVVVNHGFKSSLGPIKNWGIDMHKNSIVVDSNMETNIKGIYAEGNVTNYKNKL